MELPKLNQDIADGYTDGRNGVRKRKPFNADYMRGWHFGLEDSGGVVLREEPLALLRQAS